MHVCACVVCVCVCVCVCEENSPNDCSYKIRFFKLPHIFNEENNKKYLLHGYKHCTCKSAEKH